MNSAAGVYRGALHCAATMISERGLFTFYKGYANQLLSLYQQDQQIIMSQGNFDRPDHSSQLIQERIFVKEAQPRSAQVWHA